MSHAQRLQRLEEVEHEGAYMRTAERLARKYGLNVDHVRRQLQETIERVQRWGIDQELRHFAAEHGLSDDDVRARYERERREIEAEEQLEPAITIEG